MIETSNQENTNSNSAENQVKKETENSIAAEPESRSPREWPMDSSVIVGLIGPQEISVQIRKSIGRLCSKR